MQIYVLVDYDNVNDADRRLGLKHVVSKIVQLVEAGLGNGVSRLAFRLYGGWFKETQLSRSAQGISADIQAEYPSSASLRGSPGIVHVEFAKALLADPRHTLTHTFRPHGQAPRLICERAPFAKCVTAASCPIGGVADFINQQRCNQAGCSVTPLSILKKEEQKLVDSMLMADIAYLSYRSGEAEIVVVSADDDIWPGIASALLVGTDVHHVFPKPNYGIRKRYAIPAGASYRAVTF